MRLVVDGPALGGASVAFLRGNHSAAQLHQNLMSSLAWCGSMAGSSASFASAYDPAARAALAAVSSLVDAFASCGWLASSSLRNHARAESRSVMSGSVVFDGCAVPSGYVSVLPASVPSALGATSASLPSWASWVLDQIEGFVWPDADVELLRSASSSWRAAGSSCRSLASYCSSASASLELTRSPEIPVAVSVTSSLGSTCESVAEQCSELAAACSAYADQVESHRTAILDVVRDLLRDAVVIEGAGIFLGTVTAGVTAGGAALANAAKIAAAAPRVLRIVTALRDAAAACAAPLRLAGSTLRGIHDELAVFRRLRETIGSADDVERTMRVARLREVVHQPKLLDPDELRGLSPAQIRRICEDWPTRPSSKGHGIVYGDPMRPGRQIRVMDPYPSDTRSVRMSEGPYAVVSQGTGKAIKIPLEGNSLL